MQRMIRDGSFRRWEAFATTGRHGLAHPGRVVFRCCSDPARRARVAEVPTGKAGAEALVNGASDGELLRLLRGAKPLD